MFLHRNYPSESGPLLMRSLLYKVSFLPGHLLVAQASLKPVSAFSKSVGSCGLTALTWDYQCMVCLWLRC